MPFLILGTPLQRVQHSHTATANSAQRVQGIHLARGGYLGRVRSAHLATCPAPVLVRGQHIGAARLGPATQPIEVIEGVLPFKFQATSNLGPLISAEYNDDGNGPTLNITVKGFSSPAGAARGSVAVRFSAGHGLAGRTAGPSPGLEPLRQLTYGMSSGSHSFDLDLDDQYEVDEARGTTTFRAVSNAALRYNSVKLPELVPFVLSPTPTPPSGTKCAARLAPQSASVSSIVRQALERVGIYISFPGADPLRSENWVEGRAPYSTFGKTAAQIVQETYGTIGWSGVIVPSSVTYLVMHPPRGSSAAAQASQQLHQVVQARKRRTVTAQLPALLTMTGLDVESPLPNLNEMVAATPDPASYERQITDEMQWITNETVQGSGEIITAYRKSLGKLVSVIKVTLQDITVSEQISGQTQTREFGRVLTGYEQTDLTYDSRCTEALLTQSTIKRSYSYTLSTVTGSVIVGGNGYTGAWPAGDLLADELERVQQTWSAEGWLQRRTTLKRGLKSVKQANAEAAPAERGPVMAHEYAEQLLTEEYLPDARGGFVRMWSQSGEQPIVLYDAQSLEAVRVTARGATLTSGVERLDATPPQVQCRGLDQECEDKKRRTPNKVLVKSSGRAGNEQELAVSWTDNRNLLGLYCMGIMVSLGPRVERERDVLGVYDWRPGQVFTGNEYLTGVIRSVSCRISAQGVMTSVTAADISTPEGMTQLPTMPLGQVRRDLVLWREPGGVMVEAFKGEYSGDPPQPQFERKFVRVTGTQYPAPLDEIEWIDDPTAGPSATGNYGQ